MKYLFSADGLAAAALASSVRSFATSLSLADRTVLDVGCGNMPYRSIFIARGARYIGADIDGTPDILIAADGSLPLADESIDFVVSFQVLEHVRNVAAYLSTVRRVLRKDGRMFLSTHGVWPYHPHPTDYWRWTRDGLRVTLEDAGFRVHKMTALCGPASWIPMFPMLVGKKLLGPVWFLLAPVNLCVNVLAWLADRLTPAVLRETNAAIFSVEVSRET
ncbi:MAG TPA: methyltransferase domain-containing protein [Steroidobacteraceae bacterium]|nr:methyltransferase domain-containing protein [Steroidobacteraceae bacterium]